MLRAHQIIRSFTVACLCITLFATTLTAEELRAEEVKSNVTTTSSGGKTVTLRAQRIQLEAKGKTLNAVGNVELLCDGVTLRGDKLQYSADSGWAVAPNGATLTTQDGLTISGKVVQYNLDEQVGIVEHIKARHGELNFTGRVANISKEKALFEEGSATTCTKEHPHYEVTLKRAQLIYGKQVIIDGLGVRVYGLKLPTIPRQRFVLGRERKEKMPFSLLLTSTDGVYIGFNFSRAIGEKQFATLFSCSLGLSAKEKWRGKLSMIKPFKHGEARLNIAHKDRVEDELTRRLLLNTSPEVGLTFTQPNVIKGFSLYGDVSFGRYSEHTTSKVSSQRFNIQLGVHNERQTERAWHWEFDTLLRYSTYKDSEIKIARVMACVKIPFGQVGEGKLSILHHVWSGKTPFEFDNVDIATECRLSGNIWLKRERWKMVYDLRYDASLWELRDWTLGLVYRAHCIEWGLCYNLSQQELKLIFDLVGITTPR